MAATVRYLTLRGGTYYYERWLPETLHASVGSKKFRRSLRTKLQSEAMDRAGHAAREFEAFTSNLANDAPPSALARMPMPANLVRTVTQHDLERLESEYRRMELRSWEQMYIRADGSSVHADRLAEDVHQFELDAEERRNSIMTAGFEDKDRPWLPSPTAEARSAVEALGLNAPSDSPAFGAVVAAIRRGYLAGQHDVDEMLAGRRKPTIVPARRTEESIGTIGEVMADYLASRKLPPKSVSECDLGLKQFTTLVGDKPLETITKDDFLALIETLAGRVVGGNSAGSVVRSMSETTIKKRVGFLRAAINHAINRGVGEGANKRRFAGPNPGGSIIWDGLVPKADTYISPAKRPFRIGELNKLFQHPWFTGCASPTRIHKPGSHRLAGSEFWAPVLALFTGCRASELGGLRLAEIKLDDAYPHFVIRDNEYRGTKGGYERCVPILDELLTIGFAEYVSRVAATGADRLFPDWQSPKRTGDFNRDDAAWSNARVIRAFNRTVIPAVFGDDMNEGARREVTFHSFRGAFKSVLGSARFNLPVNYVHEVIGHAKIAIDKSYVGVIPVEETYPAVRGCDFKGLNLPVAPVP